MKAITLTQPYATLVAIGAKHIETRSWATSYCGPLAIHAAKGYGKGGAKAHKALCGTEPFCSVLNAACKAHYDGLDKSRGVLRAMAEHPFMPLGAIVATGHLVAVEEMDPDEDAALGGWWKIIGGKRMRWALTAQERAFGGYSAGRFAWLLADVRPLETPIPARGMLGLWQPDTLTQLAIKRQQIQAIPV